MVSHSEEGGRGGNYLKHLVGGRGVMESSHWNFYIYFLNFLRDSNFGSKIVKVIRSI